MKLKSGLRHTKQRGKAINKGVPPFIQRTQPLPAHAPRTSYINLQNNKLHPDLQVQRLVLRHLEKIELTSVV